MAESPYTLVCWCDDDALVLRAFERAFPGGSFVTNAYDAVMLLQHHAVLGRPFAVLVADVRLPGEMDGVALCAKAREVSPKTRRVLLSAHWDSLDAGRAVNEAGASAVLTKPLHLDDIAAVIDGLLAQHRSTDSSQSLRAVDPERERAADQARDEAREMLLACTSVAPKR